MFICSLLLSENKKSLYHLSIESLVAVETSAHVSDEVVHARNFLNEIRVDYFVVFFGDSFVSHHQES